MSTHRRVAAALVAAMLVGGCGGATSPTPRQTASPPPAPPTGEAPTEAPATERPTKSYTALLPFNAGITFFPVLVAEQLGYMDEEGIDLTIEVVNGSSALIQQMGANNAEFGVILSPNILLGYAEGVEYTAFYDATRHNIFDVKVPEDSPIQTLADLDGGTIGVIDLTRGDVPFLRPTLAKGGVDPDNVQIVALGFDMASQAQALLDGRADAVNISWNNTVFIEAAGVDLRCLTCGADDFEVASQAWVVRNDVLEADRDYVAGFGRALAKATLFAETNPEAALEIMREVAPQEQTDPEVARVFMEAAVDIMSPRSESYGEAALSTWELLQSQMLEFRGDTGLGLPNEVDLESLVSNELVPEFKDFDRDEVIAAAEGY